MSNYPHQLDIYVTEPGATINWSSPAMLAKSLFRSAAVSQLNGRKIILGHANARLHTPHGVEYLGMHYASKTTNIHNILIKGSGLGTLFHTQQGRFNERQDIDHAHRDYNKNGKSHLLKFILNTDQAERIRYHVHKFKESEARHRYGFIVNPFVGISETTSCKYRQRLHSHPNLQEGSGCTAMMVSALAAAGLSSQELFDIWGKEISVPTRYIGWNNTIGYEKPVGLRRIFQDNPHWDQAGETRELLWYSPQRMADWAQEQQANTPFLSKYEILDTVVNHVGGHQLTIDIRK